MLQCWPDDVNDRSHLIEVAPERRGGRHTCTQMHSDALRCTQMHSDALRCTQTSSPEGLGRHTAKPRGFEPLAGAHSGHTPPL